jgi:hypothetical protein
MFGSGWEVVGVALPAVRLKPESGSLREYTEFSFGVPLSRACLGKNNHFVNISS